MLDPSEFRLQEGEDPVIAQGQVRAIRWVGEEILVKEVPHGEVGSMGTCIVMLDDEFSVCGTIH